MRTRQVLVAVSGVQLAAGVAGHVVAVRGGRPFDIAVLGWRGRPSGWRVTPGSSAPGCLLRSSCWRLRPGESHAWRQARATLPPGRLEGSGRRWWSGIWSRGGPEVGVTQRMEPRHHADRLRRAHPRGRHGRDGLAPGIRGLTSSAQHGRRAHGIRCARLREVGLRQAPHRVSSRLAGAKQDHRMLPMMGIAVTGWK